MPCAADELPTFLLKGSTCKTYSISLIPGRDRSKILPWLTGEKPWSKRLKSSGATAAYRRLKANRKENLTNCAGFIYIHMYRKQKNRKSNDEKSGDNQKKQDS